MIVDHHEEITTVSELHHNTQTACIVLKECLFVANDVWMVHGCEDAHLVQSVLLFFGGKLAHLDFLHGVDGAI